MSAARIESIAGRSSWFQLLWRLVLLAALPLSANSAYGQACTSYGFSGKSAVRYPDQGAACHSYDFSAANADGAATYEYNVGSADGGTAALHNRYFRCHELDTVTGSPGYCLLVGGCGTKDRGDTSFEVGEVPVACPKYFAK